MNTAYQSVERGSKRSINDHAIEDDGYDSAQSPGGTPQGGSKKKHRRNYQACEPCRLRKVKCDLGDVDRPNEGPCAKCKREKKECVFSSKRRKSKTPDDLPSSVSLKRDDSEPGGGLASAYDLHATHAYTSLSANTNNHGYTNAPPHSSFQTKTTNQRSSAHSPVIPRSNAEVRFSNETTVNSYPGHISQSVPSNSAMHRSPTVHIVENGEKYMVPGSNPLTSNQFFNTEQSFDTLIAAAAHANKAEAASGARTRKRASTLLSQKQYIDVDKLTPATADAYKQGLAVWSKMKFVKAGWFTAEEAMFFMEYFFGRLAPMTPVVNAYFRDPTTHAHLLSHEPVLAIAMLAVASRHVVLQSSAPTTRNHWIHDKLWGALREIIQRLTWGQEQFGGGLCSAGATATRDPVTGQITWKGSFRTFGTVQALLLLTDWQPRALHFPPGDNDNSLIDINTDLDEGEPITGRHGDSHVPFAFWLEPAWRSDRMSWMLLGLAQALAFELGIFDKNHEHCSPQHTEQCMKRKQIRRMLFIYIAQISGRISIKATLSPAQVVDEHGPADRSVRDGMDKLWFDIAHIMYRANQKLFPSKEMTDKIVSTGTYKEELAKDFTPALRDWYTAFNDSKDQLNSHMRHILQMEFEYARLYINSLGLQDTLGQMVQQQQLRAAQPAAGGASRQFVSLIQENKFYIDEVRSAATSILYSASHGLGSMGALKDGPIRTFLRTLSGLMFTLKLFSLGNEASVVKKNIRLVAETCRLMKEQTVDDVHLAAPTADLVVNLLEHVRGSMIRVPKSSSRGQSRQHSPHRQANASDRIGMTNGVQANISAVTANTFSPVASTASPESDMLGNIPFPNANDMFMPPLNFDTGDLDMLDTGGLDPASLDQNLFPITNGDWLTLRWNNMVGMPSNNDGSANVISQGHGGIGPMIGDRDFLTQMLGVSYDQQAYPLNQTGFTTDFDHSS